jgi:hypothetical protein
MHQTRVCRADGTAEGKDVGDIMAKRLKMEIPDFWTKNEDGKALPSQRVVNLVNDFMNLTLYEAADFSDLLKVCTPPKSYYHSYKHTTLTCACRTYSSTRAAQNPEYHTHINTSCFCFFDSEYFSTLPPTQTKMRASSDFHHNQMITQYDAGRLGFIYGMGGASAPGGGQAAAPAAAAAPAEPAAPVEKATYELKLEKFDEAKKVHLIKEVRTFTKLGLKEVSVTL